MMDMRVMVEMMNLSCVELHRFLYSSHIVKCFASALCEVLFYPSEIRLQICTFFPFRKQLQCASK